MARAYSLDLREWVVAFVASGRTTRTASAVFDVSVSSIVKGTQRWQRGRQAHGRQAPASFGGGARRAAAASVISKTMAVPPKASSPRPIRRRRARRRVPPSTLARIQCTTASCGRDVWRAGWARRRHNTPEHPQEARRRRRQHIRDAATPEVSRRAARPKAGGKLGRRNVVAGAKTGLSITSCYTLIRYYCLIEIVTRVTLSFSEQRALPCCPNNQVSMGEAEHAPLWSMPRIGAPKFKRCRFLTRYSSRPNSSTMKAG